jgi:hypothetical protein
MSLTDWYTAELAAKDWDVSPVFAVCQRPCALPELALS